MYVLAARTVCRADRYVQYDTSVPYVFSSSYTAYTALYAKARHSAPPCALRIPSSCVLHGLDQVKYRVGGAREQFVLLVGNEASQGLQASRTLRLARCQCFVSTGGGESVRCRRGRSR